jgi:hypothetical protein
LDLNTHTSTAEESHDYRYPSGPNSTSTFRIAISRQTKDVRGSGKRYNANVEAYQDSILKRYGRIDITDAQVRERIYETSNLVRQHTFDQVWKIVAQGWDYLSPEKCEACQSGDAYQNPELCTCEKVHTDLEWTKQLEDTFIEAFSRALAVDTAFITRWDNGRYDWWSRNDTWKVYINDPYRDIEEIYFRYGRIDGTYPARNKMYSRYHIVGFLTQFSQDDERQATQKVLGNNTSSQLLSDKVYRDCVVIQPLRDTRSVWGQSRHLIEMDTAAQKKYLRSAELTYIHHGGKKRTIVAPTGGDSDVKDALVKDVRRGIFSPGVFIEIEQMGNKSVNDMVLVSEQQSGPMPFADMNKMINEDAQLSKLKIEGAAPTGALGGQAPLVDKQHDDIERDRLYLDMEEAIRSVNDVFFDKPAYTEEIITLESGRPIVELKASYRIRFRTPQFVKQPDADDPQQLDASKKQEKPNTPAQVPQMDELENGLVVEAHSVALDQAKSGFITFTGNMFQAGMYKYPKRTEQQYVWYTPEQIQEVTSEPIKTHYLELNHSDSLDTSFNRNIGYSEIVGYDDDAHKDITKFHIRAELEPELKEQGIIYKNDNDDWTIDVSPRFVRSYDPALKRDRLFLKNNAVVDPNTSMPRARLTGLDTSAIKET